MTAQQTFAQAVPSLQDGGPVRLRRQIVSVDGHDVGVATAGSGIPLVFAHGFGVESMLYAQTLARTAALGFRVIAIDVAGHGQSDATGWLPNFEGYVQRFARTVEILGIERAIFMGHSMGGRVACEIVARQPEHAIALLLLDPIVGAPWDAIRPWLRWCPPLLGVYGAAAVIDVAGTLPAFVDGRQSIKIGLQARGALGNIFAAPWNGLLAGAAILRAADTVGILDSIGRANVPAAVVQGDADLLVSDATARDTASRLRATFVRVAKGRHSWMVRDPEALPAIVAELRKGLLGNAVRAAHLESLSAEQRWAACTGVNANNHGREIDVVLPTRRRAPSLAFTIER